MRARRATAGSTKKARMMATTDEMYDQAVQIKEQGNLEGAIAKLEEVLSVDPNHVLAHSALAVNFQKAGRFKEAIEHAIRVTELEPGDPFSFTQLSVIFQRCGRIPEAESAMERARLMSGHMHH
jgi:Flp pilus assembly protein TadD